MRENRSHALNDSLAHENPQWGCRRIVGELGKLGRAVSRSTVRRLVMGEGPRPGRGGATIRPVPDSDWSRFIHRHVDTLVACDFFTKRVVTPRGLRTTYCLFFIHLGSRRVWLAPPIYRPEDHWLECQQAAFVAWCQQKEFACHRLINDRDSKFGHCFDARLRARGIDVIRTPVQAPNANAFAKSWVAAVKGECLNQFVCFGLDHLNYIGQAYVAFHNHDRPHQGLGNRVPAPRDGPIPCPSIAAPEITVGCRQMLGSLLKSYHRVAA